MAELLGTRKRGRHKEALRLQAAGIIGTLKPAGDSVEETVNLIEVEVPHGKGTRSIMDTVTMAVPKGSAVVPFELTHGKSEENVREQLRNARKDAEQDGFAAPKGTAVRIESVAVKLANDTEAVVWTLHIRKDEAKA